MTTEREISSQKTFVPSILPWLLAAAVLAVYLVTLNRWVSVNNLGQGNLLQVAKASGWIWQPEFYGPLVWLVTYPFHWLPVRIIPLALSLFSAVCAALVLALLARSVALLPHDRTHEQRERERSAFSLLSIPTAWLPPLLAVLACGLQLSFWENATATPAELLQLLLFAYIIRCLLEFRIDERQSWLARAAFAGGLGMTNDWAMIGFFPVFLVALVWIKGLSFFNMRFLAKMSLWGLAGLSLYLLLPLVISLSGAGQVSFWQTLKSNLATQKSMLFFLPFNKDMVLQAEKPLWVLTLFSLLPILIMGIRWPSYFGDPSRLGVALATLIFHIVHGALLLLCTWVALDAPLSPRIYVPGYLRSVIPLLTFYYLCALNIGYLSGYFLLVFQPKPSSGPRVVSFYLRLINVGVTCGLWLLVVITPTMLLYRNLPQIRVTNGPMLRQYADFQAQSLPARRATVLSDDARRLLVVQAAVTQSRRNRDCIFLDTAALKWPEYHRYLKKRYPQHWTSNPPKDRKELFGDTELQQLLRGLAQTDDIYYLHPSFGYYFEIFYPEPHSLLYKLKLYPTNSFFAPALTKPAIAENEAFWSKVDREQLQPLLTAITPPSPSRDSSFMDRLMGPLTESVHLTVEPNGDAALLALFYSRALDFWGAELQKAGQLQPAAARFARAFDLNPDNRAAEANGECNRNLQAGRKIPIQDPRAVEDQFGKYRGWEQVMNENGPFDEPSFCYAQGLVFARGQLINQAAQQFARVKALAPENLAARLWLAHLYTISRMPDEALQAVAEIHAQSQLLGLSRTNRSELLFVETSAHLLKGDISGAEATVEAALQQYPRDEDLLTVATQVYMNNGCYSNAVAMIDEQLEISPNNLGALVNKGFACLQINAYDRAVPPLTKVLVLETNRSSEMANSALLNRAIAYLRTDKLDAARQDYEALQKNFPTAFQVAFGLQEIAYRKKDTNVAIRYCQIYLANASTNTVEAKNILARLKELRPHSR